MDYLSTRDKTLALSAAEAIKMGLSRDGGLFTPARFPSISPLELEAMCEMSYQQRCAYVMGLFLDDFTPEEVSDFALRAYGPEKFDDPAVAPLRRVGGKTWCLELWHGPTSAFKDMALQMLPQLLSASLKKTGEDKTACILVATSGDTGKAAMEGFADVPQTKILVFYPENGVSQIQKLQMVTQEGANVGVCAVRGNFDDAQNGVKRIFSDPAIREELAGRGFFLSSANSINWGRILPQIVYYISAYCDLVREGKLKLGDKFHVCVPTGNFGNILAGYYAKKMGLPIDKLICASNANNVLTDFLQTGVYDRNRPFYNTASPSMDILISSNLERLLFDLTGSDEEVRGYMASLNATGRYEVSQKVKDAVRAQFVSGFCDDARTLNTIEKVFHNTGYLMDTHTAVAYTVLQDYRAKTADDTPAVVVSTASPFKFCDSVLTALGVTEQAKGTEILKQLSDVTGKPAPKPLASLAGKAVRFTKTVEKQEMLSVVDGMLR